MRITLESIVQGLNPEQEMAVSLPADHGPVMVLAGAGTGKTSVLTRRIAYLCAHGVHPSKILAVTFTNKAANEMKERLAAMHVRPAPMLGTFHSIGLKILKCCPQAAGVRPGFTILDDEDSKRLWKSLFIVSDKEEIKPGEMKMRKSDPNCDLFMKLMFTAKEKGARSSRSNLMIDQSVMKILDIYEAARKEQNRVDFADLISASLEAITSYEEGRKWASQFTHVLVDEFQDTSILQFEWATSMLGGEKRAQHLFCVGDDNQSIYAFRGANIENISKFVREFGAKEVMLEQNYRCGSDILFAANSLISNNVDGGRKKLWTENKPGTVILSDFDSDKGESDSIARELSSYSNLTEAAVLVRTRAAMVPVARALREKGVEYHVVGAQDFFDSKEIRDAMALVRFAINKKDVVSFERLAELFPGVGKKSVKDVVAEAAETKRPLLDICADNKKLMQISDAYDSIGVDTESYDATMYLVSSSGLYDFCANSEERIRFSNITDFCQLAGQFKTLSDFVDEMTLFADKESKMNGVTVSTIHAAKGLEWSRVYLPAMTEGHLPMFRFFGNDPESKEEARLAKEEERRLMYVAITRAKRELFISYPRFRMVNGSPHRSDPSCFIREAGL